jgi:phosphate transport system substrate-binding protein
MAILLVFLMLLACGCGGGGKETITISGAWALYPMTIRWAEEYQALHPEVNFDISAGGAGKGMTDALKEAVDIGMVSREVYESEIEKGAFWVSVSKDAVVPVANAENPVMAALLKKGITRQSFTEIWISVEERYWQDVVGVESEGRSAIRVYTRSDACGAAETWARYLGYHQEDLQGTGVFGDPGLADAVRKDISGIGYNNINFAYHAKTKMPAGGLRVIPVDLNGDGKIDESEDFYGTRDEIVEAIADGRYPSPPSRDLHFVTKGAPKRAVVREFIEWVLTDGQKYVDDAGYIKLPDSTLEDQLKKLEGE